MTTLYHRCKGKGPMVLAIKDSTDAVGFFFLRFVCSRLHSTEKRLDSVVIKAAQLMGY